jgi:hypothetical protein
MCAFRADATNWPEYSIAADLHQTMIHGVAELSSSVVSLGDACRPVGNESRQRLAVKKWQRAELERSICAQLQAAPIKSRPAAVPIQVEIILYARFN